MPYRAEIEQRIRKVVSRWTQTSSRTMFGGIAFFFRGNMFCGVHRNRLMLRLGEKGAEEALRAPGVRKMDITGKPMKGWVMMGEEAFQADEILKEWLREARQFAETLPPKEES